MKRLEWSHTLDIGVPTLDDDHRHLVQLINNIGNAISQGMGGDVVAATLDELVRYVNTHFEDEERFMEDIGFPDLEAHRQAHTEQRGRIRALHAACQEGRTITAEKLFHILGDWLVKHIIRMDMPIARFQRDRQG